MKTLLILMLLFVGIISAQENPDGDRISIHLTPSVVTSNLNYEGENFNNKNTDRLQFDFKIKIPINKSLTLTPFYKLQHMNYFYNTRQNMRTIILGTAQKHYGATLSIYF